MTGKHVIRTTCFLLLIWGALGAWRPEPASAEVKSVTGGATMSVVELYRGTEVQRDVNQASVPTTTLLPPAAARGRLEHLDVNRIPTSAAQGAAIFQAPILGGLGLPNDVGFDLGAFSDNADIGWNLEGMVTEKRSIVLSAAELGGLALVGQTTRVKSRVVLSGVMLITAADPGTDLSGVEASLDISVAQYQSASTPVTLLNGQVRLAGRTDGTVTIVQQTGAFSGTFIPLINLSGIINPLPVVQAVVFTGLELRYSYDVAAGQPFDLELTATCRLRSEAGRAGAAAVFGLPQMGLANILQRVKGDDSGYQLAELVNQQVDTTGQAYLEAPVPSWFNLLFPLCGAMGIETAAAFFAVGGLWVYRRQHGSRIHRHVT